MIVKRIVLDISPEKHAEIHLIARQHGKTVKEIGESLWDEWLKWMKSEKNNG